MKLVVITVCYNDLPGLKKTIESLVPYKKNIIKQLVIDGNSNDGTKEYLAEICVCTNVMYISERDAGIFDAMNKGMALLKQNIHFSDDYYVWFLNSGDTAHYIDLEVIGNDQDILFFCSRQTSLYSMHLNTIRPDFKHGDADFGEWLKYNSPVHQAVLFSSRLKDNIIYNTAFRNQADTKLIYEIAATHSFSFYNQVLCYFELGGNSGIYTNYNKVITQLWEDLYIRNLLTKRSFGFFYMQVFIFHAKFILNRILGKKLFHYFHLIILQVKYFVQRQMYSRNSKLLSGNHHQSC
jgi:glycosyltransferase involved in cell wall biosynthesis